MLGGGGGPSPAPVKGRWRVLLLPLPAGLSPRVCGDAAEGTDWGMGVSAAGVNKRVWGVCRTRSRHSVLGGGGRGRLVRPGVRRAARGRPRCEPQGGRGATHCRGRGECGMDHSHGGGGVYVRASLGRVKPFRGRGRRPVPAAAPRGRSARPRRAQPVAQAPALP